MYFLTASDPTEQASLFFKSLLLLTEVDPLIVICARLGEPAVSYRAMGWQNWYLSYPDYDESVCGTIIIEIVESIGWMWIRDVEHQRPRFCIFFHLPRWASIECFEAFQWYQGTCSWTAPFFDYLLRGSQEFGCFHLVYLLPYNDYCLDTGVPLA